MDDPLEKFKLLLNDPNKSKNEIFKEVANMCTNIKLLEEKNDLINIIAQLLIKHKSLEFLNLFFSYYCFLSTILNNILKSEKYSINSCDLVVEICEFQGSTFKLNIKSTSKEKFEELETFIEDVVNEFNNNKYILIQVIYGNYKIGDIVQISVINEFLELKNKDYMDSLIKIINENKSTKETEQDYSKNQEIINVKNILKIENLIKKKFITSKRCTKEFHDSFDEIKNYILSKPELSEKIKEIVPYGSVVQCTQNITSDLEITIITNNYETITKDEIEKLVLIIEKELKDKSDLFCKVETNKTKRTILIEIVNHRNIKIQMNFNNIFGVFNSNLIRNYLVYDCRALVLVDTIKTWSKNKNFNGNFHHNLSSYCYTLMVIYFLQRIEPPVLPIISSPDKIKRIVISNVEHYVEEALLQKTFERNSEEFNKNNDSIATLLLKFFIFYAFVFNEDVYCIDITNKNLVFRHNSITYTNIESASLYYFIDMFDYTYNPGAYVKRVARNKILEGFKNAIKDILQGDESFFKIDESER